MKGSIRREANGTYSVLWSSTDPATGARRQHRRRGFAVKEPRKPADGTSAREYLNGLIGQVSDGTWRPSANVTVKELLAQWMAAKKLAGKRPSTLDQYGRVIDSWVVPHVGAVRVKALKPTHVAKMKTTLETQKTAKGRQGLAPRLVALAVGVLRWACAWAVKSELIAKDPLSGMEAMSVAPAKTPQPWTEAETSTFLTATKDDRMAAAWALFLTRGPRRGEVAGLRWESVTLDQTDDEGDPSGSISIVEALVVVGGKSIVSGPKTRRGTRSVPLDEHLVAILRMHKAKQAEEKLKAGGGYAEQVYVFADKLGQPYHPDTLSAWFDNAVKAAGLRRIRLHDTRHTAATLMLKDGVPVKVAAEILGQDERTTLSTYAHVLPGMAHKAGKAHSARLFAS